MADGESGLHTGRIDIWQLSTALLLLAALMAPLVVVPGMFFPYVVPRNILFRVAVELATAVVVLRILRGASVNVRREHILEALVLFLLALAVSAMFSPARNHSLFGDFERMGGVWAWLHLTLFLLVLRSLEERYVEGLLKAALIFSGVAGGHAILGHITGLGAGFTLAGNPGLLAGYMLLAVAIALWLAFTEARHRWLYLSIGAIDLVALMITRNRSSVIGLAAGAVVGALLYALAGRGGRRRLMPLVSVAALIVVASGLVAIDRASRSSLPLPPSWHRIAATDFSGADAIRTIQWDASLAGFRDRPLLGYGPDNHHLVWSAHFDPRSETLRADVFDRAHNQFLEILGTTGIIGAISFLLLWIAIGYSIYRAFAEKRLSAAQMSLLAAANIGYAVYLVFWFIDISAAMLWLLLGAVAASRLAALPLVRTPERAVPGPLAVPGALVTAMVLGLVLYTQAYLPARASFALGTLDSPRGERERGFEAVQLLAASRAMQTAHTPQILGQFVHALITTPLPGAADWGDRERVHHSFQSAIAAFDLELARDPLNDRLHAHAAALMLDAHRFYGGQDYLSRARTLANRAVELSPRRTRNRQVLDQVSAEIAKRSLPAAPL